MNSLLSYALVAFLLGAATNMPPAADAAQANERIYGYSMMTGDERDEYRRKMREAKSAQERQALRDEHRKSMATRIRERGLEPAQMRGGGEGPRGPGAGPGAGRKGGGPGAVAR